MIGVEEMVGPACSAAETEISYRKTGTGPLPALVHGVFDDARLWRAASPFLEEGFTVYAVDRRGQRSPR